MKSIMVRDHTTTKKLLRLGANLNVQNNVGRTALMLICIETVDVINLLKVFIEYGADIKIKERKVEPADITHGL